MPHNATRETVFGYAAEQYGTTPEYLWKKDPYSAILRGSVSKKWYGIVMSVSKDKLGLDTTEKVDILNVKCDPLMIGSLRENEGYFPAYHMNKNSWISIILDGSLPLEEVASLLDFSYELTNK